MSSIDWTLIIGYPLNEALEYLNDENEASVILTTAPPRKRDNTLAVSYDELRVIGVRNKSETIELICAVEDWSIS